jgi:hypothetical protein
MIDQWRNLSFGARLITALLTAVVAVNIFILGVNEVIGTRPGGPTSSSYATGPTGLSAFASLLVHAGHEVDRLRTSLDRADFDTTDTVVIADPVTISSAEQSRLATFVHGGGQLVTTGQGAALLLRRLLDQGPTWSDDGASSSHRAGVTDEVNDVSTITSAGDGSWAVTGSALPVLVGQERVVAAVAQLDSGRIVLVADPSIFSNAFLARTDNAAFGLAAAGASNRRVLFDEAIHGYGKKDTSGLDALPRSWHTGSFVAALAALLWVWSRARRFGPAEEEDVVLDPPRRLYVDAVAGALRRTKRPSDALSSLQRDAQRRLDEHGAGGLTPDDVEAVRAPLSDDQSVLALGRAAANLRSGKW